MQPLPPVESGTGAGEKVKVTYRNGHIVHGD